MRKLLLLLGAAVVLLVGIMLVRIARYGSAQPAVEPAPEIAVPEGAAERLAGSLRFATISHEDPAGFDAEAFRGLHAYLQAAFPRVHSQLRRETVGTHSLLYAWHGSDPTLKPILLSGFSAEPSAVSSTDSESFLTLERTIRSMAPDALVAPYLVVVVTDARYYAGLSGNVFRFQPVRLTPRDLERMNGTDERIAVHQYEAAIRIYRQLVLNAAGS